MAGYGNDVCLDSSVSPVVSQKLQEAHLRLEFLGSIELVWRRLLTDDERREAGSPHEIGLQKDGIVGAWMRLRNVSQGRAIIYLAHHVGAMDDAEYRWLDSEVSKFDPTLPARCRANRPQDPEDDPDDRIEQARASHRLVLVQGNGRYQVYWEGQRVYPLHSSWGRSPRVWEFLWTAAARAKVGQEVCSDELTGKTVVAIKNIKSRLSRIIHGTLYERFERGSEPGTYRLRLPSAQIELIELEPGDWPMGTD